MKADRDYQERRANSLRDERDKAVTAGNLLRARLDAPEGRS